MLPSTSDCIGGSPREWLSIRKGLVNGCHELGLDIRGVGHQLLHEHDHQMALRIYLIRGAVGAAPTESPHTGKSARAVTIDGLEAQAEAQARCGVKRPGLIGRHQLHRARPKYTHAIDGAAAANHFEEAGI